MRIPPENPENVRERDLLKSKTARTKGTPCPSCGAILTREGCFDCGSVMQNRNEFADYLRRR